MKKILRFVSVFMILACVATISACGKQDSETEETFGLVTLSVTVGVDESVVIEVKGADNATFASTDESVAIADENGKVTGVNAGECKIRVSSGGSSKYCSVKVMIDKSGAYSIRFGREEYFLAENSTFPLSVALYNGADEISGASIEVTSADENVAAVENEKISAKVYGATTLNATCLVDGKKVEASAKVKVVYRESHDPIISAQSDYGFTAGDRYSFTDRISVTECDGSPFGGSLDIKVYSDYGMTKEIVGISDGFTVERNTVYYIGITAKSGEFDSYKKIAVSDGKMLNGAYVFPECDPEAEFGTNGQTTFSLVDDDEYVKVLKVTTTTDQPYTRGFVLKNLHKKAAAGQYVHLKVRFDKIVNENTGIFGYTWVRNSGGSYATFSTDMVTISKNKAGKWADVYFKVSSPKPDEWTIEFYDDGQRKGDLYSGLTCYIAEIGVVDGIQ